MKPALRSMTGFGLACQERDGERIEVEIRTVNHRSLKISSRIPDALTPHALEIERILKEDVSRGSVLLDVRVAAAAAAPATRLNLPVIRAYAEALRDLRAELGREWVAPVQLEALCLLPGATAEAVDPKATPEAFRRIEPVLREALRLLLASRETEGAGIARDLAGRLDAIERIVETVRSGAPAALVRQMERIRAQVAALLQGSDVRIPDEAMARETAFLAERADVSEELQRLQGHVLAMREALAGGEAGQKVEFLSQEMLREANTMSAKLQETELIDRVLAAKLEIAKIREQAQNIE